MLYQEMRSDAHRRLIYDEFFFFQLGMALRKRGEVLEQGIPFRTNGEMVAEILRIASLYADGRPAARHLGNRTGHGVGPVHESPAAGGCRFRKNGRGHGGHDHRL